MIALQSVSFERAIGDQIGEAAKRTALSIDAIRFYEKRALSGVPPDELLGHAIHVARDPERGE